MSKQEEFYKAIKYNDIKTVELLLKDPCVDPSANDNISTKIAAEYDYIDIIELLLKDPRVDPSVQENFNIRIAAEYGHTSIVKLLLKDPRVDPSDHNNRSIQIAAYVGHTSIVELLLKDPRVDPSVFNNSTLRYAALSSHTSIVELLLKDPRVDPNITIQYIKTNIPIIKLILEDHRTKLPNILKNLSEDYLTLSIIQRLLIDDSDGWWVTHVNNYRDNFILVIDLLSTFIHRDIIECIFAEYICKDIRKQLIKRIINYFKN